MSTSEKTSLTYAEQLWLISRLTAPAIRQAVRSMRVVKGSSGLDAGCGAGCHLGLLAGAVGPSGRVTALDLSPENLDAARAVYGRAVAAAPIEFVQGDITELPFEDGSFDWVWCADTLWPGAVTNDPVAVVREFKRVTRPGGKVALLHWSGQSLLPGYPILEARLYAGFAEWAPYFTGIAPETHYMRAAAWLRKAGLVRPRARTFLAECRPPFDQAEREALAGCYSMFWGELEGRVSPADWTEYRRLCDLESPDFIADVPDYYAFVTYTLSTATRAL